MGKLLLIDGHSILNRAYYGVPKLSNSQGLHTNAIYGFVNIMLKIIETEKPDYLTVSFDLHGPTFRHEMFEGYKGQRKRPDDEFVEQVPMIKELLSDMGILIVSKEGYEADDIIGTLAKKAEKNGHDVTIVSGDKDLLQLATDKTKITFPRTKKGVTEVENYYSEDVKKSLGVTPKEFIDVKAIMGDSSDNYKGIPGIGEKNAFPLIEKYHSIENVYANADEITPPGVKKKFVEHYEEAVFCKKLATICTEVELDYDFDDAKIGNIFTKEAYDKCRILELKSLLNNFDIEESNDLEESFVTIKSKKELDDILKELHGKKCGFSYLIAEEENVQMDLSSWLQEEESSNLAAIAFSYDDKIYSLVRNSEIKSQDIRGFLGDVFNKNTICNNNIKNLLHDLEDVVINEEYRENFLDVGVGAYLLNPLVKEYSVDVLSKEYLDILVPDFLGLFKKRTVNEALRDDESKVLSKLCYEAYTYNKCADSIEEKLKIEGAWRLFSDIEMPLVFTLFDMEKEGILMNEEELRNYGEDLSERIKELTAIIYKEAGVEFNINSPKQLGEVLFGEENLAIPGSKKTKSGFSTAADVLEKLAPEYEIINNILEYRKLTKLKSTYVDGLIGTQSEDGRIHCTFEQTVTATGRLSCTEPNLQNIPIRSELGRLIRKVFYPKKGFVFVDADYSQVELRVLAHMSQDEELMLAFNQNLDVHKATAAKVFNVEFDDVTDSQRRSAKAVNFGIVYGESSFGLSENLNISKKEAKKYIDDYFVAYPKMKDYLDGLVDKAKEEGFVSTLLGRKRPVLEISSNNFMTRQFGERIAMNSPIQGTAADIIKIAMVNVDRRIKEEGLKSRLILQVHDELLIEASLDEEERIYEILKEEMMNAYRLDVPLEIDIHSGENWYEAK